MARLLPADWLVVVVTVQYAAAACLYAKDRLWPSAVVFFGYALANVGILWGLVVTRS